MILKIRFALLVLLMGSSTIYAQETHLDPADRVRLKEAFELSRQIGDSIWEGWSQTPFTFLLVTEKSEFLFNHSNPTEDFQNLGYDEELRTNVYYRPNTGGFSLNFLATFPAINGQNTVVMGQPHATKKSSTYWVVTALHEHFHQMQFSSPGYWQKVTDLDLSGGDTSGMWMLNYPFPYERADVIKAFTTYESALAAAIQKQERQAFHELAESRSVLRSILSEKDARYQDFQLWQEGVARYTETVVAKWARDHFSPSEEFAALPDYVSYSEAATTLSEFILEQLSEHAVARNGRGAFYAAGAAEAFLLDIQNSSWKGTYLDDMPSLEAHTVKR